MDYEKKYNEALERAKKMQKNSNGMILKKWLWNIFPELKESEDERIRNAIIDYFDDANKADENPLQSYGIHTDKAIAWLEKQGKTTLEAINEVKVDNADKVEPKFKVGNWIVYNKYDKKDIDKIVKFDNDKVSFESGEWLYIYQLNEDCKLWTINDAKDGDVLACNEEILLFKSYSVQGRISLYCWYNGQTNNFHSKEVDNTLLTTRNKICPATKEQRDLLFQKMKEEGYEFDYKRKELKEIEL